MMRNPTTTRNAKLADLRSCSRPRPLPGLDQGQANRDQPEPPALEERDQVVVI
jgi:hypothetical protein